MNKSIIEMAYIKFIIGMRKFFVTGVPGFTIQIDCSLASDRDYLIAAIKTQLDQIFNKIYYGTLTQHNLEYFLNYLENYEEKEKAFLGK